MAHPPTAGVGGGSAQREHDRRVARRAARVRARYPRLGGLVLALTDEPSSTRVWAQGAAGERAVAALLDGLADHGVIALHDRAMRHPDGRLSRANIDHLVVAPTGIWAVDAKTHRGTLRIRRSGGLFRPRVEHLFVRGRDQTRLVDGVVAQAATVERDLRSAGFDIPVRGALCFVGTGMPRRRDNTVRGVPVVGRRDLARLLRQPGPVDETTRQLLAETLVRRFPVALGSDPGVSPHVS